LLPPTSLAPEYGGGEVLQNVDILQQHYTNISHHGNESSNTMKSGEFLDSLNDYHIFKDSEIITTLPSDM